VPHLALFLGGSGISIDFLEGSFLSSALIAIAHLTAAPALANAAGVSLLMSAIRMAPGIKMA
jgi:hypothetical protein